MLNLSFVRNQASYGPEKSWPELKQKFPSVIYRKMPKISPEAYIFQRPFLRGYKYIYRFCFVYFVFEGNVPSTSPRGAYIWRGDLTEGFLRYRFGSLYLEGLIHGRAYFWNFTVTLHEQREKHSPNLFLELSFTALAERSSK